VRSILFLLATLVVAGLLVWLWLAPIASPFVRAALVNLAVVGWSSFVLPLRGLPAFDSYYRLRKWERSGRIFHLVGVHLFREVVRRGPLSVFNRALPEAWHAGDPERIETETRAAEGAHAVAFLVALALALAAWASGRTRWAAWLAILDVPMNLYPVLLQRDHRHRLAEKIASGEIPLP
jgi:hypothetical protein